MITGILLTLVAAAMNAFFPLPMRHMKKWAWENIWTVWSVVALIIIPWLLAIVTVPNLTSVYAQAGMNAIGLVALFGLLWGVAQVLFGLSVDLVGMSLTFAVVNGMSSAMGSWIPLVVLHPGGILTPGGLIVSAGVVGVVGGVAACSWAGQLRSKQRSLTMGTRDFSASQTLFWRRLAVTITCGILAPCLNLGFAFGQKISLAATRAGSSPAASTNAALAVVLTAGFVSNIAYCIYRLSRNRTVPLFSIPETKKYLLMATVMGVLWIFSFAIYGSSTFYLGAYGTVVGWPVLMANITIISSLIDIAYGDWSKKPLRVMALGVAVLVVAVGIVSYGMYRLQHLA
jgi:L-rhamnose-H+ transport protein